MIVDEVEIAVGEHKPDIDLRPLGEKLGDDRQDMQSAKNHRRGDDEVAARRGMFARRRALGVDHLVEDALGCGDISRARVGQREFAGRAGQKPRLQMRFEVGNLAADRRQRHAKLAARGGQAAGLHDRHQKGHGFEAIHIPKNERVCCAGYGHYWILLKVIIFGSRFRPHPNRALPMPYGFLDIASTPSVRAAQETNGSGEYWANFHGDRAFDRLTPAEAAFIAERDSLYMATVSESGWPYVQHRGGPPGFIRILDERTLAIPDFRGNRQYISTGNLATNDRAALILMDYPHRRRLKLYAHVEARDLTADRELAAEADAAGLPGEGRARSCHPSRRVRLELSAAHHAAFQRS